MTNRGLFFGGRPGWVTTSDLMTTRLSLFQDLALYLPSLKNVSVMDPTSEISRFEDRIRRQEALVRGREEVQAASLDEQFAALEADEDDVEIEARLAELKTGG